MQSVTSDAFAPVRAHFDVHDGPEMSRIVIGCRRCRSKWSIDRRNPRVRELVEGLQCHLEEHLRAVRSETGHVPS